MESLFINQKGRKATFTSYTTGSGGKIVVLVKLAGRESIVINGNGVSQLAKAGIFGIWDQN